MTESATDPIPVPNDTPLDVVVDRYSAQGFEGQFEAELGGLLHCLTCGASTPAQKQSANDVTRLEGPSDPSDMEIIVPVKCPSCHTLGVLISNYGPEASAAEAEVLRALTRDNPTTVPRTPLGVTLHWRAILIVFALITAGPFLAGRSANAAIVAPVALATSASYAVLERTVELCAR